MKRSITTTIVALVMATAAATQVSAQNPAGNWKLRTTSPGGSTYYDSDVSIRRIGNGRWAGTSILRRSNNTGATIGKVDRFTLTQAGARTLRYYASGNNPDPNFGGNFTTTGMLSIGGANSMSGTLTYKSTKLPSGAASPSSWTRTSQVVSTDVYPTRRPSSLRTFNKAGLNVRNRTGETINVYLQYLSDHTGSWRWHQLNYRFNPGQVSTLNGSNGRTLAAAAIKFTVVGQSGTRYGLPNAYKRMVPASGTYRANRIGLHNLNVERRR